MKLLEVQSTKEFASRLIELPCKIGDYAWVIRNYKGHIVPQRGVVSEMYFTNNMRLVVAVKHVARGEWGKAVFPTREDAMAQIERTKTMTKERLGGNSDFI